MTKPSNVLNACEYSIQSLVNIQKGLLNVKNPKSDVASAVGGIIITLTANLLQIVQATITKSSKEAKPDARDDLKAIQAEFNTFLDSMINHE